MVLRVGAREARNNFADLLGRVGYGGEVVVVERSGKPLVAMVPVDVYERWVAEREERFGVIDRVRSQTPDVPEAEVERDVDEAIDAVRSSRAARRP